MGSGHLITPAHFSGVRGSGGGHTGLGHGLGAGHASLHKSLARQSSLVGSLHRAASTLILGQIHEGHFCVGGIVDLRT